MQHEERVSVVGVYHGPRGRYYVKAAGQARSPEADSSYLGVPSRLGYFPNHPAIERLAFLLGKGRAALAEILWPWKAPPPGIDSRWLTPEHYLSRDVTTYHREELPHRNRVDAEACHFVFNVLTRNWDACITNRLIVHDLPVLYDFGETFNPALFPIERFVEAISKPHAMGHFCDVYCFAASFTPGRRRALARALDAFVSTSPPPEIRELEADLPETIVEPLLEYLDGAFRRLPAEVEFVLNAVGV